MHGRLCALPVAECQSATGIVHCKCIAEGGTPAWNCADVGGEPLATFSTWPGPNARGGDSPLELGAVQAGGVIGVIPGIGAPVVLSPKAPRQADWRPDFRVLSLPESLRGHLILVPLEKGRRDRIIVGWSKDARPELATDACTTLSQSLSGFRRVPVFGPGTTADEDLARSVAFTDTASPGTFASVWAAHSGASNSAIYPVGQAAGEAQVLLRCPSQLNGQAYEDALWLGDVCQAQDATFVLSPRSLPVSGPHVRQRVAVLYDPEVRVAPCAKSLPVAPALAMQKVAPRPFELHPCEKRKPGKRTPLKVYSHPSSLPKRFASVAHHLLTGEALGVTPASFAYTQSPAVGNADAMCREADGTVVVPFEKVTVRYEEAGCAPKEIPALTLASLLRLPQDTKRAVIEQRHSTRTEKTCLEFPKAPRDFE